MAHTLILLAAVQTTAADTPPPPPSPPQFPDVTPTGSPRDITITALDTASGHSTKGSLLLTVVPADDEVNLPPYLWRAEPQGYAVVGQAFAAKVLPTPRPLTFCSRPRTATAES